MQSKVLSKFSQTSTVLSWPTLGYASWRILVLSALTLHLGCQPVSDSAQASCPLKPGDYPAQSVAYQGDHGIYELMLLNAPACVRQPIKLKSLRLARFADEKTTEKVKLSYDGEENSTLYMAEDFQIAMTQTVTENGVSRQQSGSWSPFLTGLAGGVAGGIAGNMLGRALFNKPQHYTPPPMTPGNSQVRGYGGVGDTREGAVRSYQQNYAMRPKPAAPAASGLSPSSQPAAGKSSFFKTRSDSSANPRAGAVRSYQPSGAKRSFFKSRRR